MTQADKNQHDKDMDIENKSAAAADEKPSSGKLPAIPLKQAIPPKPSPLMEAIVTANKKKPNTSGQSREVPRFDLAEDIMIEQRKTNAEKRKSPTTPLQPKTLSAESKQPEHSISPRLLSAEPDEIIRDIVARDIERLCNGFC